ncbi:MAG: hypothetical protein JXR51_03900 [Bacteroidales bacterium]|nr:hypothetical protein [Bacteroidales bacterium]MBN2756298.1 hypothetical protein [Bacteroidales bacterium]
MKISKLFVKSFDLKPEEGIKFTLLFLHSFFLGLFIAFYFVPANSVFLEQYGSEQLPFAYIVAGIAGYLTSSIYSSLQKRVNSKTLFLGAVVFMLVIALASRLALNQVNLKYLSFFVFIWAWPFISLVGIVSGGLALKFLNLIQVKRLYGLMNMGAVIASIISYLAIPVLLSYLDHSYDLLFIGDLGLIASMFFLFLLYKTLVASEQKEVIKKVSKNETSFSTLFKDKYFRLIFLSATFSMIAIYVVDFGFLSSVKIQKELFSDSAAFSKYLALVYGGLKIGEMIISYFSSRILSKYGVKLGLTILPITVTLIVVISLIVGLTYGVLTIAFLALMTVNKSVERILRRGLDDPAFNILYQPLPSSQKMAVQTKVGVVMQISITLAGLILLALNLVLKTPDGYRLEYFPIIILPILVAWVIVARQLYLAYKSKLRQILVDISRTKKRDSAKHLYGSEYLTKKFKKFNEKVVEMSVSLLSETNPRVMEPYASTLLNMRNKGIKAAILGKIDPSWRTRIINNVKKIYITDKSENIRQLALKAKNLLDFTDIAEPDKNEIERLKQSEEFNDKLLLTKLLIKGILPLDDDIILRFLLDDDKTIKRAAVNLASKSKSEEVVNKLIELIRSDEYYHICADALMGMGDKVLTKLELFFKNKENEKILLRVIEILAKIGSLRAKSVLVNYINYPNRDVQFEIISALYFCKYQADTKELPIIKKKIEGVVENILWIYASVLDIETERNTLKLLQAIDMERELYFEILFKLLSFMYEPRIINLIRKNIIGKNTIFAIEIIHNFIGQDIKQLIIPLFDDISSSQKIKKLNSEFPQKKLKFSNRLINIITRDYDKIGNWTVTKAIELLGKKHSKQNASVEQVGKKWNYDDIKVWTPESVEDILYKIRKSEMPDEIFVCLYHTDELIYSTAAKIIYNENPVKCADYLERMSDEKKDLLDNLTNDGYILIDRIKLLKKNPLFFSVPENHLAKLAKLVRVVDLKEGEDIDLLNSDKVDKVIIVIKGNLSGVDLDNYEVKFSKNEIVTYGINISKTIHKLKALTDTNILTINRFDYYNLLVDQTEIIQHIFEEVQEEGDEESDEEETD